MATIDRQDEPAAPQLRRPAPIDRRSLNLPNLVTLSRLLLSVFLFAIIGYRGLYLTAAVLFVFAASTDFLDGYLARKYGQITTLGRILDPFVDKIIVCGAFIFLLEKKVHVIGEAGSQIIVHSGVNAWMVLIVIAREMFVTSLRGFMEQHGLDFSADKTGKIKMALQCIAVTASLLSLAPQIAPYRSFIILRDVLLWTMVIYTAYSGVAYLMRAIQALRDQSKPAEETHQMPA